MQCLDYSNAYQDVLHSLEEDGLMSFMSLASAGLRAGLDRMSEDGLTTGLCWWDEQNSRFPIIPTVCQHIWRCSWWFYTLLVFS